MNNKENNKNTGEETAADPYKHQAEALKALRGIARSSEDPEDILKNRLNEL